MTIPTNSEVRATLVRALEELTATFDGDKFLASQPLAIDRCLLATELRETFRYIVDPVMAGRMVTELAGLLWHYSMQGGMYAAYQIKSVDWETGKVRRDGFFDLGGGIAIDTAYEIARGLEAPSEIARLIISWDSSPSTPRQRGGAPWRHGSNPAISTCSRIWT